MQKVSVLFVICVLLCEVSPKVPIRKEDLFNKKAALSKQLSPSVPKWDDIALKQHTKDKQTQNKQKTMINMLKVVSAKEIDIPGAPIVKNETVSSSNLNVTETNSNTIKHNDANQNKTSNIEKQMAKNKQTKKSKPNNTQSNTSLPNTTKKHAANETIGARLALFLQQNTANLTKEKPNVPEISAPTMIPIFKPMPSSTKNSIPQPLADELIKKDNFIPQDLNPEQLKNLDNIELNPHAFNPMSNKAVLTPLLASQAATKEVTVNDVNQNNPSPQNNVEAFNNRPIENNELQDRNPKQNKRESQSQNNPRPEERTNSQSHNITLAYEDPQNDGQNKQQMLYKGHNLGPVQYDYNANLLKAEETQKTATSPPQLGRGNNERDKNYYMPIQNGPQYELKISPALPSNPTANFEAQSTKKEGGTVTFSLNPQFILEHLSNFDNIQFNRNPNGISNNQKNVAINQEDKNQNLIAGQAIFGNNANFIANPNDFTINNYLNNIKNAGYDVISVKNLNNLPVQQNDFLITKHGNNLSPANTGGIPNDNYFNQRSVPVTNVNPMPVNSGFQLPCMTAADILEDLNSAPKCQQGKPVLNSYTENPVTNLQCEKPILVDTENIEDDSVAIVFKPKNISLMQFYGDLLKKITLTVLVPYHISKLTSS